MSREPCHLRVGCDPPGAAEHRSGPSRSPWLVVTAAVLVAPQPLFGATVETRLTSDIAAQNRPDISGDRVVYEDNRNGNWDIYLYELSTSTETRLTTNGSDQTYPAIDGAEASFMDYRAGHHDIYLWDITEGRETRLTNTGYDQQEPAMSGGKVAYTDTRNGNEDIYVAQETASGGGGGGAPAGASEPAPVGSNVSVTAGGVRVTFEQVTSAGDVVITGSRSGPPGYELIRGTGMDISFTGVFSGSVTVIVPYDEAAVGTREAELRLWHYANGQWHDITTNLNTTDDTITGVTSSLSPFVGAMSRHLDTPATSTWSLALAVAAGIGLLAYSSRRRVV